MRNFIIADNQELTSFALHSLLLGDGRNSVSRVYDMHGLTQALKESEASVVVLDYKLFDFSDEQQLLIVSERFQLATWVLISDELTPTFLKRVIYSSNQFSVVFKDEPMLVIADALKSASVGKRYISQRVMEVLLARNQEPEVPDILTSTEIEIVKAIALGKTTKEIAAERFSSVHTITTHRKNIFRKLSINTAHEAIKYALRAGWVDSSEFYM